MERGEPKQLKFFFAFFFVAKHYIWIYMNIYSFRDLMSDMSGTISDGRCPTSEYER
jgi:hypothetical protein